MNDAGDSLTLVDICKAQERIEAAVHRTPVISSELLNEHCGAQLFFKCENLQKVGAFKARGACNAVFSLPEEEVVAGVATHSSGNHGAALAMAAGLRGMVAHIVMPENASQVKKEAVRTYGGRIVECESTLAAREEALQRVIAETGATVIHPYDDTRVIAGQGTVGLEILDQLEELDAIVAPVGGGGLLAGIALAIKSIRPEIEVIGAEPAGADDAFRSFGLGRLVPQEDPRTIADGLLTSLGQRNYGIIRDHVDTIVTVAEDTIVQAMQLQWSRLKSVVEPSGAVSFAAVLEHPERFRKRRTALVISGGNIDLNKLPW